jgi:hypothetical protein
VTTQQPAAHRERAAEEPPTATQPHREQRPSGINKDGVPDEHLPRACLRRSRQRAVLRSSPHPRQPARQHS